MKIHLLLFISILSISLGNQSCKSTKKMSNQGKDFIQIGFGGGIVGKETSYALYQDGSLESEGKVIKNLSNSVTKQLFSNFTTLGLQEVEFQNPGNTYQFIEFKLNGVNRRMAWNPSDNEVQKELKLYYSTFNHYVQKYIK